MILIMGIAGSGKGTQGKLLADKYGYHLLSTGDLVRKYATEKQRERMLSGDLLADDEIIAMVDECLRSLPDDKEVIFDGFPRTIPQAQWLLDQVKAGRIDLKKTFHLIASREAVKDRLKYRARDDDVDHAIEQRFEEYAKSTAPILNWLKDQNVDVVEIKAEQSVEKVHQDIISNLK